MKSSVGDSASVLVVGGSLVGLSTAMFLAWRGVSTIVVERHAGSSLHPRAVGYTPRTMELFRTVGLDGRIPEAPAAFRLRRVKARSLAGDWLEESTWTPSHVETPAEPHSFSSGAAVAQDGLEPILRERAEELGADIRASTEFLGFEQDHQGVAARVLRREDGFEHQIRADYLIAADGAASPIREALGIGRQGRGHIRTVRSVLFRAPLDEYLERGVSQFEIEQPGLKAFLTTYNDGRWVLMFTDDVARGDDELHAAIVRAIGRGDLPIEIITTGCWELGASVADRFAAGRVFLAGDAAHALPPSRGGFGANTGIGDAHNLAWKLAAVLGGEAGPALLDSYDAERRPVAWRRHQQIFARPDYKAEAQGVADDEPIIGDAAMEFGQLYRSHAVIGVDDHLPPALTPNAWAGQPGVRAPHLWVERDGERISTLDLFGRGWTLLACTEAWRQAGRAATDSLGVPVEVVLIDTDIVAETPDAIRLALGLGRTGASLVRPDGIIAFRSADLPLDVNGTLEAALARLCARA